MYKMKITRGTTLAGKEVKVGAVVEVDRATRSTLLAQNQAVDFTEENKQPPAHGGRS